MLSVAPVAGLKQAFDPAQPPRQVRGRLQRGGLDFGEKHFLAGLQPIEALTNFHDLPSLFINCLAEPLQAIQDVNDTWNKAQKTFAAFCKLVRDLG